MELYTGTRYNLRGTMAVGTCALPCMMAETYLKIGTEGSITVRAEGGSIVSYKEPKYPKPTRLALLCFAEMDNRFCCWYHASSFA
jgi:hypothetical protein